ncbi:hypothetical protein ALC57_07289 [Trachymyrmex cornetzi]|uniref:Uncharacterized protein n=1 Tax=Trachymyrmex cornetzi TaxID=471704 RepID=A0A195E6B1_9HYME|nr:hypothetical protein ALC57_07289 [Trachymyrmex cornetzi]
MHPCGTQGRDKRRPSPLEGFHGSREKDHSTELRIISERVVVEGERSRDERRKRVKDRLGVGEDQTSRRATGWSLPALLRVSSFSSAAAYQESASLSWFLSFSCACYHTAGLVTGRDASRNSSTKSCIANRFAVLESRLQGFWQIFCDNLVIILINV